MVGSRLSQMLCSFGSGSSPETSSLGHVDGLTAVGPRGTAQRGGSWEPISGAIKPTSGHVAQRQAWYHQATTRVPDHTCTLPPAGGGKERGHKETEAVQDHGVCHRRQ